MSLRIAIATADISELNVSEFCRTHGIGRTRFYELRKRFEADGLGGLDDRSRAPINVPARTRASIEDEIVRLRKQLSEDGFDAGPATIHHHLGKNPAMVPVPSEATIWRILDRRGFVVKNAKKRPRSSWTSFQKERRNELWQIDSWTWHLAGGERTDIIDLIDDCTRKALGSVAVDTAPNAAQVLDCIVRAGEMWGLPQQVLSDNGTQYVAVGDALAELGVATTRSAIYHPQTCGKVERFHQTMKKWLTAQDPVPTIEELQNQIDTFITYYNTSRPHRSLNRRTPDQVWAATPASGPADKPINIATRVFTSTVCANGYVRAGRRYRITVGAAHIGQESTIVLTGDELHVLINGKPIRRITTTRDQFTYPLYDKPGRPPDSVR